MSYLVLARRTRPQSLDELVGQNPIRASLKSMLESQKIPHAFLFTGTRGTGKTSTARILAKSLNCELGIQVSPCQICRHCKQITACSHEDVFEIDGASHTGVDNIRELRESARFYPVSARYKIFIIDEVHMLSTGAFNALLKTLEEPPEQVIFILATTELHKIPVTIRSRCLTLVFKKIVTQEIALHLKTILMAEQVSFAEDALTLIAREGQGSLRDSLSLLEQVLALRKGETLTVSQIKESLGLHNDDIALKIFQAICQQDQPAALNILKSSDDNGLDLSLVFEATANYFRSALLLKVSKTSIASLLTEEVEMIQKLTSAFDSVGLSEVFKLLSISVKDIQRSINPLSLAEITVIDAITRIDWISASDMLLKVQAVAKPVMTEPSVLQSKEILSKKIVSQAVSQLEPVQSAAVGEKKVEINENPQVDLVLYKKFVEAAKKRSPTLGARLSFVKIEKFSFNEVKFADTPENKTYLSFDLKDKELFWKSLDDIGIKAEVLKGKNVKESATSLHQVEEVEKKNAYSLKEKEIMSRESVKNLMILSKEIRLTPIEN